MSNFVPFGPHLGSPRALIWSLEGAGTHLGPKRGQEKPNEKRTKTSRKTKGDKKKQMKKKKQLHFLITSRIFSKPGDTLKTCTGAVF